MKRTLYKRSVLAYGRPPHARHSARRVLVRALHAAHSPLHTSGCATEQPAEHTSLGCQLGPPAAKTDRQKTATLQRPCLCDGSHVGWLSPTRSLWLSPHTDAHRSMHASPAAHRVLLAMLLLARALLLLICAPLLARAMLRAYVSACLAAHPGARPPVGIACAS
jgi:hypothetical protein